VWKHCPRRPPPTAERGYSLTQESGNTHPHTATHNTHPADGRPPASCC
jgi:hypothetical protein